MSRLSFTWDIAFVTVNLELLAFPGAPQNFVPLLFIYSSLRQVLLVGPGARNPPVPASPTLGLQVQATTPPSLGVELWSSR